MRMRMGKVSSAWVGLLALGLVACGDADAGPDAASDAVSDAAGETATEPDAEADADPAPDATPEDDAVAGDDATAEDAAHDAAEHDAAEHDAAEHDAADDATPDADPADADPADADPAPDAAPDAGDAGQDVPPAPTCADFGGSFCLVNSNCDAGEICQAPAEAPQLSCCLPGEPGAGEVGVPCSADDQCAFGKCIARDDGQRFCSGACEGDLDCPGFMQCSDLFGWCYPKDSDWQPETCAEAGLGQCFYNDNCGDAERCEDIGGAQELLCCTPGPRGTAPLGAACSAHTDCAFGRCLSGQCSDLCEPGANPCPAAGMTCNDLKGLCEPL